MTTPMTLNVTDDSGYLAIVNADKYNSFISETWEFPQLLRHFVKEMNENTLIVWATNSENEWTIDVLKAPSNMQAYREITKTIEVTTGKLYLTNYEDLTMAAQFADDKLPSQHNSKLCIEIDNGYYEARIRQLFNPKQNAFESKGRSDFEVIFLPGMRDHIIKVDEVLWSND